MEFDEKKDMQQMMVGVWKEVLKIDQIDTDANFFELGGDSLHAVDLQAAVEKKFGIATSINRILACPTIASYAGSLEKENSKNDYRSLVPLKSTGNKMPLYIIHGSGYNFTNFTNLATFLDAQQPLYSLQPLGIDGEPFDTIEEIAAAFISEILKHNTSGPYALAGYSFGGYVAIEMKRQLENMGKVVKFIGVSDTDAAVLPYKKKGLQKIPKKILRQVPKMLFIAKSFRADPSGTFNYQRLQLSKKLQKLGGSTATVNRNLSSADVALEKITAKQQAALNKYALAPFHGRLHLFKANKRLYFVDDSKYLGWKQFALDGVTVHNIPGDHRTMFHQPNVEHLAEMLQNALDKD